MAGDKVAVTAGIGTDICTESITSLNGGAVSERELQRAALAIVTSDATAVDLPGDATNGLKVQVATLPVTITSPLATSSRSDTFTGTGSGTAVNVSTYGRQHFGIQVKGTGATPTSWTVHLQVSLDGTNYANLLTHDNDTDDDGGIQWTSTPTPGLYFRSSVEAVALGSATNIIVTIVGMP
jgi:hypothetical protein